MKVAIRTDASLKIGTGHVMRCLTLAEELTARGAEILFICRSLQGNLIEFIRESGYRVTTLVDEVSSNQGNSEDNFTSYNDWLGASLELDAEETHSILKRESLWKWLIVDHYSIDKRWEIRQKNIVNKILVIDDLADRSHSCDVLLDQNYYSDMGERYNKLLPVNCGLLLGPRFSLLRKEFREQREKLPDKKGGIKKIFVFFGGVDINNMTGKVLGAIMGLIPETVIVDAVIGATNPHREKLKTLCDSVKNINLHIQVMDMAKMMAEADLGIGAGGTATWERCCLGLPTIAWSVAENQKKLLKDSANAGLVYCPDFSEPTVEEIAVHIKAVLQNKSICKNIKVNGLAMIDAKGVTRVANMVCAPVINLMAAVKEDVKKIYQWRNEQAVRQFSHSSKEIDFDQHEKWFEKSLMDHNRYIFIASESNNEIGVLRFDITGDEAEISVYLIKNMYGRGYGEALVVAGENWLVENCPEIKYVIAEVLPKNKASIWLFEKCGYTMHNVKYRKSICDVKK